MADGTAISWTDATWQVTYGCDKVSPGCDNCYAIKTTHRLAHNPNPKVSDHTQGLVEITDDGLLDWTGVVRLLPHNLGTPSRWRKPRRIFVDSQADLFHKDVPTEYIARVFAVMATATHHIFQVLTKRHARLRTLLNDPEFRALVEKIRFEYPHTSVFDGITWPLPNVHIGVSVEDQRWADLRIPALLDTPAAVRWISAEPLLGPVDLHHTSDGRLSYWLAGRPDWTPDVATSAGRAKVRTSSLTIGPRLDWVVAGGESGARAHAAHPDWFRRLAAQCHAAGAAFQFKQWGEWGPLAPLRDGVLDMSGGHALANDGTLYGPHDLDYPHGARRGEAIRAGHDRAHLTAMYRVGKHAAGRELDGVIYDEFPTTRNGATA